MAEKFDPAAHDKHAANPREAASDRQFSGIRSRQRSTTGTVEAGRRPRSGFALGQGQGGLSLGLQRLI